jgi:coenzyme F420-reducing hydrogenase delta subunit
MINNFILIGKETNYFLIDFLKKKEIFFVKYDEGQNFEERQVFFVSFDANEIVNKKEIEKINKTNKEVFIILPQRLKDYFVNKTHKKIYYPVKIAIFNNFINSIFSKNQSLGDLIIRGNYIENTNYKARSYLTETQINILKLLMSGNGIKKDKIKIDILKITSSLDTKSLESHLSRIRKKLIEIKSKATIISVENGCLKLITPRVDH